MNDQQTEENTDKKISVTFTHEEHKRMLEAAQLTNDHLTWIKTVLIVGSVLMVGLIIVTVYVNVV